MTKIQSIRGMNDVLPALTPLWQHIEGTAAKVLASYGFQEIRMPLLEQTELFCRSIGEVTDIVEKEMYTFEDRNGDSLTLRPEGTASCVRACEQHGLLFNQMQRLWYGGPMFRHERPQKGRQRQFHQIGAEAFGMAGPDIDAELIALTARLWRALGIAEATQLELNSIGSAAARQQYKARLVDYLRRYERDLDEDSRRRLATNPLRILDSKDAGTRRILDGAPLLADHLDGESSDHFAGLCARLDQAGIAYRRNDRLVRGLDYYGKTVFEWTTDRLGAQGTICAGGRYDGLVEQLGGRPTPAVGFAMGIERLSLLVETCGALPASSAPHVYLIAVGDAADIAAFLLAEQLREALPQLRLVANCGGGSFKSQFKRADRSGAEVALIVGDEEAAQCQAGVKWLRDPGAEQQRVAFATLPAVLRERLALADRFEA